MNKKGMVRRKLSWKRLRNASKREKGQKKNFIIYWTAPGSEKKN